MPSALTSYLERSRRVALLMAWLGKSLEAHESNALSPSQQAKIWGMVGDLEQVETQLKAALCFIAAVTEEEVNSILQDGGESHE